MINITFVIYFSPSQGSGKVELSVTVEGTIPAVEVQAITTPRRQEGLRHGHTAPATTNNHNSINFKLNQCFKVIIKYGLTINQLPL